MTRRVLLCSRASASFSAIWSRRPTLVRLRISRCVLSGSALNNSSNFSSETLCKEDDKIVSNQVGLKLISLLWPKMAEIRQCLLCANHLIFTLVFSFL